MPEADFTTTPDLFTAFGIPYELEPNTVESSLGMDGAVAGLAVGVPATTIGRYPAMRLETSGAQSGDIEVKTTVAGPAGVGGYVSRVSGAGDDEWFGCDWPMLATDYHPFDFDGSGIFDKQGVSVVTIGSTDVVTYAHWFGANAKSYKSRALVAGQVDAGGSTGETIDSTEFACSASVTTRDGRVITYVVTYADSLAQVQAVHSGDLGETWEEYEQDVLPEGIDITTYEIKGISAAMLRGEVMLVLWVYETGVSEQCWHYSSLTGGVFTAVAEYAEVAAMKLLTYEDRIYVAWVEHALSAWSRLTYVATAGQTIDITTYTSMLVDAGAMSGVEMTLAVMSLFRWGRYVGLVAQAGYGTGEIRLDVSLFDTIRGTSQRITASSVDVQARFTWYDGLATSTEYFSEIAATVNGGRLQVYHITESSASRGRQLGLLQVGGPTNRTMHSNGPKVPGKSLGWSWTEWGIVNPTVYGWTWAGTGSVSFSAADTWMQITTTAGNSYVATRALTEAYDDACLFEYEVRWKSGATVTTRDLAIQLALADATHCFALEVWVDEDQIRAYDRNLPGIIATATLPTGHTAEEGLGIRAEINNGVATVSYRMLADPTDSTNTNSMWEREYYELFSEESLTDDGGLTATSSHIKIGHFTTTGVVSQWRMRRFIDASSVGSHTTIAGVFDNPGALSHTHYSVAQTYALSGVFLRAVGGVAVPGNTYEIGADATYSSRRLLSRGDRDSDRHLRGGEYPSVIAGWRATAETGRLAFRWHGSTGILADGPGLFMHIEDPTFPEAVWEYHATGGAWTEIGTVSWSYDDLPFKRRGRFLYVDTAGVFAAEWRFSEAQFAGGGVLLDPTGAGDIRYAKVRTNIAGRWANDTSLPFAVIELDELDDTLPTGGTMRLWARVATAVFFLGGPATEIDGMAIRIDDVSEHPNGFPEASVLDFGDLRVPREPMDWGNAVAVAHGVVLQTADNGVRMATIKTGPRTIVTWSYTNLFRTSSVRADDNIVVGTVSDQAGAHVAFEAGDIIDFLTMIGRIGPLFPIVYMPGVPRGDTGSELIVLTGPRTCLRGRAVTEEVRLTRQAGELATPWMRGLVLGFEGEAT